VRGECCRWVDWRHFLHARSIRLGLLAAPRTAARPAGSGIRFIEAGSDAGAGSVKLTTLKTVLQGMPAPRVQTLAARPQMVERLRGGAGVRDRAKIKARDCGLCQECKRRGRARPGSVVDHIVALWAGGSDEGSNKELLCTVCHDAKSLREAGERAAGASISRWE
jgi:hypothetical protein